MSVRVHIGPVTHELLDQAVVSAGADPADAPEADAIVWTDPFGVPTLLGLINERTRWVSLPVAGVDRFIAAGIIDDLRAWTATKGIYGDGVAEHAIGLLLACSRRIAAAARRRTWVPDPGWRLRGEAVAVLGTGGIGKAVAEKLAPFGARCIGVNRSGRGGDPFHRTVPLDGLAAALTEARAVVIGLPYTASTKGLIGAAELDALGSDGVLVNVARGEIVQTDALVAALQNGRLGAAGLDVTDPEPLPDGHPLWDLPTAVITPHTANPYTRLPWEAHVVEYAAHIERNIRAFASRGELEGRIDLDRGY